MLRPWGPRDEGRTESEIEIQAGRLEHRLQRGDAAGRRPHDPLRAKCGNLHVTLSTNLEIATSLALLAMAGGEDRGDCFGPAGLAKTDGM